MERAVPTTGGDIQTMVQWATPGERGRPRRVLLVLSGTEFAGGVSAVELIADQITAAYRDPQSSLQIAVVLGGGNYCPKEALTADGVDVVTADRMNTLAAVINGVLLSKLLNNRGTRCDLLAPPGMGDYGQPYSIELAKSRLDVRRVIIMTGGIGPYLSTTLTAAKRALEVGAGYILVGRAGYTPDPERGQIGYNEALVMSDFPLHSSAVSLMRDHELIGFVFDTRPDLAVKKALTGEGTVGTMVAADIPDVYLGDLSGPPPRG